MKKSTFIIIALLPLALMGHKGCKEKASIEHPAVEIGQGCEGCHDDGRTRETRPEGHDLAFERTHGKFIQKYGFKTDTYCYVCHNESQCTQCHQQEPPQDHTEFWRLRGHGVFVGMDRSRCFNCHRVDFCDRCHAETEPLNHSAAWGSPSNRHCLGCHFPLSTAGSEQCAFCHRGTPSHAATPSQPSNAFHAPGASCRSCHVPLTQHPDNGMDCQVCHTR